MFRGGRYQHVEGPAPEKATPEKIPALEEQHAHRVVWSVRLRPHRVPRPRCSSTLLAISRRSPNVAFNSTIPRSPSMEWTCCSSPMSTSTTTASRRSPASPRPYLHCRLTGVADRGGPRRRLRARRSGRYPAWAEHDLRVHAGWGGVAHFGDFGQSELREEQADGDRRGRPDHSAWSAAGPRWPSGAKAMMERLAPKWSWRCTTALPVSASSRTPRSFLGRWTVSSAKRRLASRRPTSAAGRRSRGGRTGGALSHGPGRPSVSDELERWLAGDGEKKLGSLILLFEEKSFAILFVVLLGVPALPLPTGGATHVFEVIALCSRLELIAGREEMWLPERWRQARAGRGEATALHRGFDEHDSLARALLPAPAALSVRPPPEQRHLWAACDRGLCGRVRRSALHWLDTLPALGVVLLSLVCCSKMSWWLAR